MSVPFKTPLPACSWLDGTNVITGRTAVFLGLRTVVQCRIEISDAGLQPQQPRVIRVDDLAGLCVGVADLSRRDGSLQLSVKATQQHARPLHALQSVPRHDHFRGGVGAELNVQARHRRCLDGIER